MNAITERKNNKIVESSID